MTTRTAPPPQLWAIVQCTGPVRPDCCSYSDDLLNQGWTRHFRDPRASQSGASLMEIVRLYRPAGVILHSWRGLAPNGSQAFFNRDRVRVSVDTRARRLWSTMQSELAFVVRDLKRMTRVWGYEGPAPSDWGVQKAGSSPFVPAPFQPERVAIVKQELALGGVEMDGHFLDGSGNAKPGTPAYAMLTDLGTFTEAGIESMATADSPGLASLRSFTDAGQLGPDGMRMASGAYDPEHTDVELDGTVKIINPKFAPVGPGDGERIVLDVMQNTPQRERMRARLIVKSGCSLCRPLWAFPLWEDYNGIVSP